MDFKTITKLQSHADAVLSSLASETFTLHLLARTGETKPADVDWRGAAGFELVQKHVSRPWLLFESIPDITWDECQNVELNEDFWMRFCAVNGVTHNHGIDAKDIRTFATEAEYNKYMEQVSS